MNLLCWLWGRRGPHGQVFPDQSSFICSTKGPHLSGQHLPDWKRLSQAWCPCLILATTGSWAQLFNGPQSPGNRWVLESSCLKVGNWKEEWRIPVTYIGSLCSRPKFSSSFRQWLGAQHHGRQGLVAPVLVIIVKQWRLLCSSANWIPAEAHNAYNWGQLREDIPICLCLFNRNHTWKCKGTVISLFPCCLEGIIFCPQKLENNFNVVGKYNICKTLGFVRPGNVSDSFLCPQFLVLAWDTSCDQ